MNITSREGRTSTKEDKRCKEDSSTNGQGRDREVNIASSERRGREVNIELYIPYNRTFCTIDNQER